jgi:hypothetical protein
MFIKLNDTRQRIQIADQAAMIRAFHKQIEECIPVLGEEELWCEGGISEISCHNLVMVMEKFGKPLTVNVNKTEVVLVKWEQGMHLATGFAIGYYGTHLYKFAEFGEMAGFREFLDLYDQTCLLDRTCTGTLWSGNNRTPT